LIDPQKEILVASGANGALSSFIMALINPGDEMIIFEPTFPMYLDHLKIAGGTLKTVPLYVNDK
jgi:aspartate/methionine/tyrosine aminotransferase